MHTPATESREPGVGEAAKQVADHAKTLVKLEIELAKLELAAKIGSLAMGIGLGLGAAIFALFALGFGLAAAAAGLATALSTWLALLIVMGALFALAGLLGVLALRAIRKATPPLPEQAIDEAKRTTEALKSNGVH